MMEPSRRLLDMNPDGSFRDPPRAPLATRVALVAIVIAVLASGLALAALAFWLAIILVPVAFGAAAIAYLAFRIQIWRSGKSLRRF